ncbi:MAG: polysaccharide deacetylase family protein [Cytophagales bacterium]|nr:polysaccharide deacetylase family protein [Armatimonadota bacterium]
MSHRRNPCLIRPAAFLALPLFAASVAALSGCDKLKFGKKEAPAPVPTTVVKKGPTRPDIDYAKIRPNELGRIPVIMYHEIGLKPDRNDPGLVRTPTQFKADLQSLYNAGFLPVNLSDVVNDSIRLPAGKSPVVLTFDDARETQFKLLETDKALQIDPNCAIGILDAFHKAHPEWEMRGTFFVLPKSKVTMESFRQVGMGGQKLAYLVEQGMEIGNHTTLHKSLRNMSPAQIQEEIGNANNVILASVPDAKIRAMAVPMGKFPKDKNNLKYLMHGSYQGKRYDFQCVMAAAYRPIPSPAAKEFNPEKLERISPADGLNGLGDWVKRLKASNPYPVYVSDGDPNVLSFAKGDERLVNFARLEKQGKLANPYSPFGGAGGAKPIVAGSDAAAPPPVITGPGTKPITGG